jgi:hypothetical protein
MGLFDAIGSIGSALIGGGLGYLGSQEAAKAAKKAGRLEWQQYLDSRADFAPFRETGVQALGNLKDIILGGDFSKFYSSPGYQFRMDQGREAIDRSAAARGALNSGQVLKELDRYGQGIASDEYGNYLNQLYNLAGYGQTATQNTAQLGANAAQGYGNAIANAGYLRGTGYANLGNTLNQGVGNALASYYYRPNG